MSRAPEFPTTFADEIYIAGPGDVAAKHAEPIIELGSKGYDVTIGLRRDDIPAIAEIAGQLGTREFCPNDLAKRWGNEEMAEKQLAKDGGRGVVVLRGREDGAIAGYGWTGRMSDEEKELLKGCENTFALRLHEGFRGQGLAKPFSKAIVAGSMAVFGARNIGLETWGSNTAAVKTYLGAGAVLVTTVDSKRPTLDTTNGAARERDDVRLYMKYPWSS